MSASPSWIKAFLEVLESKTAVKILGAIFVISLAALCSPKSWKDHVYMTPFISWLWPWLVVVCAFCGLMLLFTWIDHFIWTPRGNRKEAERERKAHRQHIETTFGNLSRDEISLLQQYADGDYSSREFMMNGVVLGLVKKGILYQVRGGVMGYADFNIEIPFEPYLRKQQFQQILDRITQREQETHQSTTNGQSS